MSPEITFGRAIALLVGVIVSIVGGGGLLWKIIEWKINSTRFELAFPDTEESETEEDNPDSVSRVVCKVRRESLKDEITDYIDSKVEASMDKLRTEVANLREELSALRTVIIEAIKETD